MKYLAWLFSILVLCLPIFGQTQTAPTEPPKAQTIATKTAGMEKWNGFFPLYWESKTGKLWLEISKWNKEFLYIDSLPGGVGSNEIGLDRGRPGESRVVRFYRAGSRVLLIQSNYSFRATASDPEQSRAVEESFASSTLWGFEVAAEQGDHALVDATSFFLHDIHNVTATLKQTQQGDFKLDESRSAFYLARTKNFPQNTEVEVLLTFTGDSPGQYVQEVVPNPRAITVREHHSFVQLPEDGFKRRAFDSRGGFYFVSYKDFSAPIDQPLIKRWIVRHRLAKKDPHAAMCEAVKPIVYYMDRGAPEPIRSALMEGASWWNQAFEAAGYKNAFRVELLPEGADPMDVRYNLIEWVHRSTRGWSYGNTVIDPRTGEIIKGHVLLGSQRVRQDFLIAQGLLAPYETGKPASKEMEKMALARLRQLAAHEVGHTLGLMHNFFASTVNRASVMDYPHPIVDIKPDGSLDLSRAYATGIGEWDKLTIRFGYSDFAPGTNESEQLNQIIKQGFDRGLIFISDEDARPAGGAHPLAHLWDNGPDPIAELAHVYDVRAKALARFSENNIPTGAPMSTLEDVLVPVYLFHRYQVEAVSKMIGGQSYTFALRGDGQTPIAMIPADTQRKALQSLLQSIQPEFLILPDQLLRLIPPRAPGYPRSRETFKAHTGLPFDPVGAAETSANMTIGLLLNPDRAARLVEYHAQDKNLPALQEIIDRLLDATWKSNHASGYRAEIQRAIDSVTLYDLMQLAANADTQNQARAIAFSELNDLKDWLSKHAANENDSDQKAHFAFAISEIRRFQEDPKKMDLTKPLEAPAGAPIGSLDEE
jgi:Met-zincin/Domain of unknown function (DUF5117)/Domain of unknown function (DUF5118)